MEEQIIEQTVETQTQEPSKPSAHETNLNAMRQKLEESERARRELEQRAQNYPPPSSPTPVPAQAATPEEDDLVVDNDEYVQAKHIRLSNKKLYNKLSVAQQELKELKESISYLQAKVETSNVRDFDQVVSEDNIKTFSRLYPEEYSAIMSAPNMANRAKLAYNMIKRYGVSNSESQDLSRNEEKFNANRQKPQSASVVSHKVPQTPLSQIGDNDRRIMTEEYRKAVMEEVERKKQSW